MRVLFLVFLVVFGKNILFACKCEFPETTKHAYDNADLVIYGKVIKKEFVAMENVVNKEEGNALKMKFEKVPQNLDRLKAESLIEVHIEVVNLYKGNTIKNIIKVLTPRTSAACGFTQFNIGEAFIVFGKQKLSHYWLFNTEKIFSQYDAYWTNHCVGTSEYNLDKIYELEAVCIQYDEAILQAN